MIKLKVSYEREEELLELKKDLRFKIDKFKKSNNNDGHFKKAYIILKDKKTRV